MKVFRFMSKDEFDKFMSGETLVNNLRHYGLTNSIGFCFLDYEDYPVGYAYEFLAGIVSEDYCVVFETNTTLKEGYGIYADPIGFFETINVEEYSTTEYSDKEFKAIKYCTNFDERFCNVHDNIELNWKEV